MCSVTNYIVSETRCIQNRTCFNWKIHDFHATPLSKVGVFGTDSVLESDVFVFEDTCFRLGAEYALDTIQVRGKLAQEMHLFVHLNAYSDLPDKNFMYTISLKNRDGRDMYRKRCIVKRNEIARLSKLSIASKDDITALLVDDCLTIFCEMMSLPTTEGDNSQFSEDSISSSHVEDLINDFKNLLSTKENCDVVFHVEDQEIPAHSVILSARSPYFSVMFKQDMTETRSRQINITDFTASAINHLLRYLYTGTLEDSEEPVPYSHLEDLCNDLKKLFSTKENSDVVLHVEGKDIPAHSAILSARSPYFSAMFNHDMVESRSRRVNITDFGISAINYLLRYLYTGTLEDLKDIPGHLLTELYTAADKYSVKGLKDMCLQMMMSTLSESNIEDYATLALKLDVKKLTDAVVKYFACNDRLIKSDMWRRLEKTYPTLAILVLSDVMRRMNEDA